MFKLNLNLQNGDLLGCLPKTSINLQEAIKNTIFTNLDVDFSVTYKNCLFRDTNLTNTSKYTQKLFK